MGSITKIIKKTYTNPDTGEIVPYKRLAIVGVIDGETRTLEIKLERTELLLAEMLLNSTETPIEAMTVKSMPAKSQHVPLDMSGKSQQPNNETLQAHADFQDGFEPQ